MELYDIIKAPVITEKSAAQGEAGNKYVFWVDPRANKADIRKAVEKIFNVKVTAVNTQRLAGKVKRMGRHSGRRPLRKKAYVTLREGDTIELFAGV
ncbi:MAG TPA: 50S ribosomal protein L23 [Deltaproteobacteria bacterium]|nr:50S ribosomal protein L23 [Deltaproteobacteria bacterium]